MSTYELTLVFREEIKDTEKKAQALVPGKVRSTKSWGVRDLAYPIKGAKRGGYLWLEIELGKDEVAGLDKSLRQNETVLRHLLISSE